MIIAATGHRSERCEDEPVTREKLRNGLKRVPPWEESIFICGMANGTDLWAGSEALSLGFEIWVAKPWAGHIPRVGDKALYEEILAAATKIVNVVDAEEFPGSWCYQKRNEWMVDHSTHILAYWDGVERGGTWNCIKYARGKRPIRNVHG